MKNRTELSRNLISTANVKSSIAYRRLVDLRYEIIETGKDPKEVRILKLKPVVKILEHLIKEKLTTFLGIREKNEAVYITDSNKNTISLYTIDWLAETAAMIIVEYLLITGFIKHKERINILNDVINDLLALGTHTKHIRQIGESTIVKTISTVLSLILGKGLNNIYEPLKEVLARDSNSEIIPYKWVSNYDLIAFIN